MEKIGKVSLYLTSARDDQKYQNRKEFLDIAGDQSRIEKALSERSDWDFLYNFSDMRRNLLEWYEFGENASVLEIGSECGALTGLLSEKAGSVTAVDVSGISCRVNAVRNQNQENLRIYAGTLPEVLSELPVNQTFSHVVIAGQLIRGAELLGRENMGEEDSDGTETARELLNLAVSRLAEDGVLILAAENKYSLNFFAGAREIYTGKTIDKFETPGDQVSIFSREQVFDLIKQAGLVVTDEYEPVPDYCFPKEILSEETFLNTHIPSMISTPYDWDRLVNFDEFSMWEMICKDGKFKEFADSFLLFSQKGGKMI